MAAHVAGEPNAFRELVDRYGAPLLRLMLRDLANRSESQDLVQQTFLQLHRARNDFDPKQKLRPWIYTIALNLKREYFRIRRRRPSTSLEERDLPEPSVEALEPERREAARLVHQALETLPRDQRQVIELHWFDGLSFPEIGACLGVSTNAAKIRAHRGYSRLRQALGDEFGPETEPGERA